MFGDFAPTHSPEHHPGPLRPPAAIVLASSKIDAPIFFLYYPLNTTDLWPEFGFFKQQPCDYGTEKENYPENTVLYINQAYQSYKDNKKVYYAVFFIIGQINECLNPPENIDSYEFKEREIKIYRPRYDTVTGQFLGLYETLGYLTVRGDANECFLDYGYSKKDSKTLYSFQRRRMPNSFSRTLFNRHQTQYESGALSTKFSGLYLFLPSITDRVENINRHRGSVNLLPVEISEEILKLKGEFNLTHPSSITIIQTEKK